jgi:hypothetical protein
MRESTSWNQAKGSTRQRLQLAMKLINTAAVLPPSSLPKERPVRAADGDVAVDALGGAVVDFQVTILQETRKRIPLVQRIAHSPRARTLLGRTSSRILSR